HVREYVEFSDLPARAATGALPQRICCSGGEPVADANVQFLSAALTDGLQQLIRAEQSGISGFGRAPTNRGDSRLLRKLARFQVNSVPAPDWIHISMLVEPNPNSGRVGYC